jgi:hypothetical protein
LYLFHCTFGHHGIFSLTPVFLVTLFSWGTRSSYRDSVSKFVLAAGLGLTVWILAFYLSRTHSYNYGGVTSGLRWAFWLIPLWVLGIVPALDRWCDSRRLTLLAAILLGVSVFSITIPRDNPWQPPWLVPLWAKWFPATTESSSTVETSPSWALTAPQLSAPEIPLVAKYAALKPAFDKRWGPITAGNASPLTDGASAVVLMRDDVARALGHAALARVRSFAFVGIDPAEQLLQGPAYAAPRALDAARIKLSDLSLVDMHEAFAAQVLSNLQALASRRFAEEKLGRSEAIGEIPDEKLNVYGGSIALGHPFAATGTRQIATMANELARRGGGLALITQCAAGGLGAAMVLEG